MTNGNLNRRQTGTAILCGALIGLTIIAACTKCEKTPSLDDFDKIVVTIKEGETAWEIARRYCPSTLDIREYLDCCAAVNEHDMGFIEAGEKYIFYVQK